MPFDWSLGVFHVCVLRLHMATPLVKHVSKIAVEPDKRTCNIEESTRDRIESLTAVDSFSVSKLEYSSYL